MMLKLKESSELTATEVAHAWQDFRKWCVCRAIDSKAEDIIATAKSIAAYVITKDELEKNTETKKEE